MTKMAAMPIYGKKPLKIFFSRTRPLKRVATVREKILEHEKLPRGNLEKMKRMPVKIQGISNISKDKRKEKVASFSSLPLIHSRRIVVSYKPKFVHEVLVNRLFKLAQEKVWLGELTVLP